MSEAAFWSWVASEKAKLDKILEQGEEPPTLLEWLEREIQVAHEAMMSATLRRNEEGQNYWKGYEDALNDLKSLIERRWVVS